MPNFNFTLSIGLAGAEVEETVYIDEEYWDTLTTTEAREECLRANWVEWSSNYIDGGWEEVE